MFPLLPSTHIPALHPGIHRCFEGTQMATPLWPHRDATHLFFDSPCPGFCLPPQSFPSQGASSPFHITTARTSC